MGDHSVDIRATAGRLLVRLALAGTLVHGLYAAGLLGGPAVLYDAYVYLGVLVAGAVACVLRAWLVADNRAGWAFMAASSALYLLASVYWQVVISPMEHQPYPNLADAGWLVAYPLGYLGLMLLMRQQVGRFTPAAWLDGVLGGMAVAALGAAVAYETIAADTGSDDMLGLLANLAYPVCDLLMLGLVIGGWSASGWRLTRATLALGSGLIALAVADAAYLYQLAADTYVEGELLDSLWPLGMALIACAAWSSDATVLARRDDGRLALFLTLAFTLAALGMLLYGALSPGSRLNPLAAGAATLTLVAACMRTGMAFAEVARSAESRRQALTDELTGLPNRRLFHRVGREALEAAVGRGGSAGVLLLDLDGFKEVNDTLGHDAGDQLLRQIGARLGEALGPADTLARLGGDEFAVLLPGRDAGEALKVAARIRRTLERTFDVDGLGLLVDASVGVTACPEHASTVEDLLQRADVAMYVAKSSRTGAELYASGTDANSRDRLALLSDLRRGIDSGELVVHYQPQADARTGRILGFEALVRWQHRERGLIGPNEFLPAAEQTGIMRALTLEVVSQALDRLARWREEDPELVVSVNLAAVNMLDRDLPVSIGDALRRHGAEPSSLILEVTENVVMADPERAAAILGELRAMGVGIALDDFGTGHSSLSWLQSLPVDELKVDRGFVARITSDAPTAAIVKATLEMARALALRTVAEGAEDDATWALLDAFGCERIQGFVLARPLPPEAVPAWLAARRVLSAPPGAGRAPARHA